MSSLSLSLLFISCLFYNTFGLCSWNRAVQPIDEYADTLNFLNGEWTETGEKRVTILNGQPYWKKTLNDNCGGEYQDPEDASTIWLYYYVGTDGDKGQWIISPYWNTLNNVYAKCGKDLPNPTDVTKCNGHWLFAEDGEPSLNGSYVIDTSFNFRPGACPQLTCERIQLITDSDDPFVGVYYRQSRVDLATQNIYIQSNEASDSGVWYLYFNDNIFSWMINDEINTDCSAATDGTLTSMAEIDSWPEISALDNQSWAYYATDATTETRTIYCYGVFIFILAHILSVYDIKSTNICICIYIHIQDKYQHQIQQHQMQQDILHQHQLGMVQQQQQLPYQQ